MKKANNRTSNMKVLLEVLSGIALLLAMMTLQSCSKAEAGPNGGDVVPLNGQAKAEVVANSGHWRGDGSHLEPEPQDQPADRSQAPGHR